MILCYTSLVTAFYMSKLKTDISQANYLFRSDQIMILNHLLGLYWHIFCDCESQVIFGNKN